MKMLRLKSSILIAHLLLMVRYYSFSHEWMMAHEAWAYVCFYGFGFLLVGTQMMLQGNSDFSKEISRIHGVYMMLLGAIYGFYYTLPEFEIMPIKMCSLCVTILTIFVVILLSAWRFKLLK